MWGIEAFTRGLRKLWFIWEKTGSRCFKEINEKRKEIKRKEIGRTGKRTERIGCG